MKGLPGRLAHALKRHRCFLLFVVTMAVFRTAVADWNYVPSGSMEPTLVPGDVLVVNKLAFGPAIPFSDSRLFSLGEPERGDIITFFPSHTEQCLVKRVIAMPGDRLYIEGANIWLNGEKLPVDVTAQGRWERLPGRRHRLGSPNGSEQPSMSQPIVIPEGQYFVLGDNRTNSFDSRYWGLVDESQIVGKVAAVGVNLSTEYFFRRLAIAIE